jgi:Copper type II ascorbate-dependent monooxygenase, C-terminal domain
MGRLLAVLAPLAACLMFAAVVRGGPSVTYANVAPILNSKCAGCHTVGGIAPFSLATPRDARAHADLIAAATQARLMPPWPPGRDSQPFVGQAHRRLTARELDLIARWVKAGAPAGPRIAPPAKPKTPKGIVLAPAAPYLPHPQVGLDDYHCSLLEPNLSQGRMVTAAHVLPGRPDIVHHVILYEVRAAQVQEARALNRASGGHGWTCFGGPGVGVDSIDHGRWLGAWVPGKTNDAFPAGTGMSFPEGAAIVMQVHYNLIHRARPDRTRISLELAPAGEKVKPLETKLYPAPIEVPCPSGVDNPLCQRSAAIAALGKQYGAWSAATPNALLALCGKTLGAAVGLTTSCERPLDGATTIYAVAGHMHVRGVDIRVDLERGGRWTTLLHIPRWSFHWQDVYTLQTPIRAPAGSVVRVTCRYDNSQAKQPVVGGKPQLPRYLVWGEGTTDEMCLGVLQTGVTG